LCSTVRGPPGQTFPANIAGSVREPAISSLAGRLDVNATFSGCSSQPVYVRTRRASSRPRALGAAAYPAYDVDGLAVAGADAGHPIRSHRI
jgi:hypothetical protein